jgi:hypothetical protein
MFLEYLLLFVHEPGHLNERGHNVVTGVITHLFYYCVITVDDVDLIKQFGGWLILAFFSPVIFIGISVLTSGFIVER